MHAMSMQWMHWKMAIVSGTVVYPIPFLRPKEVRHAHSGLQGDRFVLDSPFPVTVRISANCGAVGWMLTAGQRFGLRAITLQCLLGREDGSFSSVHMLAHVNKSSQLSSDQHSVILVFLCSLLTCYHSSCHSILSTLCLHPCPLFSLLNARQLPIVQVA
jgi:hypothetical protein